MPVSFILNGEVRHYSGDPMTPLVDVIRNDARLTGAKAVCREGFCGACMIHQDGAPKPSCLMPVGLAEGTRITTIEGLAADGTRGSGLDGVFPDSLRRRLIEEDVVQCGMCFPGMVMTLTAFLMDRPDADREAIKQAMVGNVCRCTGYELIIDAALRSVECAPAKE